MAYWAGAGRLSRAAIGAAVVLGLAASARAEPVKGVRWVSADAAIYLEVGRPAQLLDRAKGDALQSLLAAIPAYDRYYKSDDYLKLRQIADFVAGKLDTTWEKGLRDLTGGGVVFAVEGDAGRAPNVFLIVSPADPAFLKRAHAALIEMARKDAADKGRPDPFKQAEYRGVTGHGGADGKGAFAIVADTLVVADRGDSLKLVIDRALDGPKAGAAMADDPRWKSHQKKAAPDALAWGFVGLDRLRRIDPKSFGQAKADPPQTLLFGSWIEALKKAPWVEANLNWADDRLAADLTLPTPKGGYPASLKGFVPPKGAGASALLKPPGTVANLSLWRDLSAVWEARADLLPPQDVQNLAQLDVAAGQFFGGRDFGTGVLGALGSDWRLVVARQDYKAMKPVPDVKAPAFALVVDLKPDDEEFAQRLKVAFQSFVGLANLGAAQSKAPPLELGSEVCDGVTISTSKFMPAKSAPGDDAPVHYRQNFSPSVAQVGNQFILSSSVGLARDLIRAIKAPARRTDSTLVMEADGGELAGLVKFNHKRLVMQNMLEKGHDKAKAEEAVATLAGLLKYLGHARLTVHDNAETLRLALSFALGK